MSKESKQRDLWRQVFADAHGRHPDWCKGCGHYRVVNDHHRADCTAVIQKRRCKDCRRELPPEHMFRCPACVLDSIKADR